MKFIPILLLVFVFGCYGRNFDLNKVDQVKTKQDALDLFGKPQSKSKVNGMEGWGYNYSTPFGAKSAVIVFDKNGNVVNQTTGRSK